MQGITVALFPEGIQSFCEMLASPGGEVQKVLSGLKPADHSVPVNNFTYNSAWNQWSNYQNINVSLSNGSLSQFSPTFQGVQQQQNGNFQLVISAQSFNANYSWVESYQEQDCSQYSGPNGPVNSCGNYQNEGNTFNNYSAGIGKLVITPTFTFTFSGNVWTLPISTISAVVSNPSVNLPSASILQHQDPGNCNTASHIDAATSASITAIDFTDGLTQVFGGYLTSIPASGQLTPDITFAFGVGDSPLAFPNDQGLTVGVTGIATYKGQAYSGIPPKGLPVPSTVQPLPLLFSGIPASEAANFDTTNIAAIKADFATYSTPPQIPNQPPPSPKYPLTNPTVTVITQGSEWQVFDSSNNNMFQVQLNTQKNTLDVHGLYHLQMYVSDYTLNGLYWAFFMDNQLNLTINPGDPILPDPNILKVRTWTSYIRELLKYAALNMQITITPVKAPTVTFQTVYLFTEDIMNDLQKALPAIYSSITGMQGNVYPNQTFLEQDLTNIYGVDPQYFQQIEKIAETSGAAVFHDIQFNVTIVGAPPINGQAPFMEFTVNRYDVLENLGLAVTDVVINGVTQKVQTLTFGFHAGTNSVSVEFNQSNFLTQSEISNFGTEIWPQGGEPAYDNALTFIGNNGTPLPIMKGFEFVFEQAQLSIQVNGQSDGFIGILSNVKFTG